MHAKFHLFWIISGLVHKIWHPQCLKTPVMMAITFHWISFIQNSGFPSYLHQHHNLSVFPKREITKLLTIMCTIMLKEERDLPVAYV